MSRRICSALLTVAVVASLVACSPAPQEAAPPAPAAIMAVDGPSFDSVQALAENADAVVSVRITASRDDVLLPSFEGPDPDANPMAGTGRTPTDEELTSGAVPITVHDAVVVVGWAGLSESAALEITELGDSTTIVDGQPDLAQAVEEDAVLFLAELPDGRYSVLGQGQGILIPSGDRLRSPADGADAFDVTTAQLEELVAPD